MYHTITGLRLFSLMWTVGICCPHVTGMGIKWTHKSTCGVFFYGVLPKHYISLLYFNLTYIDVHMSFYILQIFVIGFFFTDMTTVAEDASGSSTRVSVPLNTSIPATTSHHFLPAYALCCIDQSVVEEFTVIRDESRLRRQRAQIPQQLWDDLHEMSGMGRDLPPTPPPRDTSTQSQGGPLPRAPALSS